MEVGVNSNMLGAGDRDDSNDVDYRFFSHLAVS